MENKENESNMIITPATPLSDDPDYLKGWASQPDCDHENGDKCDHCQHKNCLTGCAKTYREAREEMKEKQRSKSREPEPEEREIKPFDLSKLAPPLPDPFEGTYKQFQCENYDKFLELVGAGKMTINMVIRAGCVLTISQEIDTRWLFHRETIFKVKSMVGMPTNTRKVSENRFVMEGEIKEMLEDWDQREVLSTLVIEGQDQDGAESHKPKCSCTVNCPSSVCTEGRKLILHQRANKDKEFHIDSSLVYELDQSGEELTVTNMVGGEKISVRKFRRNQKPGGRKLTVA